MDPVTCLGVYSCGWCSLPPRALFAASGGGRHRDHPSGVDVAPPPYRCLVALDGDEEQWTAKRRAATVYWKWLNRSVRHARRMLPKGLSGCMRRTGGGGHVASRLRGAAAPDGAARGFLLLTLGKSKGAARTTPRNDAEEEEDCVGKGGCADRGITTQRNKKIYKKGQLFRRFGFTCSLRQ
jgi:hypothetical protein